MISLDDVHDDEIRWIWSCIISILTNVRGDLLGLLHAMWATRVQPLSDRRDSDKLEREVDQTDVQVDCS